VAFTKVLTMYQICHTPKGSPLCVKIKRHTLDMKYYISPQNGRSIKSQEGFCEDKLSPVMKG
jgi:hypothetical protein